MSAKSMKKRTPMAAIIATGTTFFMMYHVVFVAIFVAAMSNQPVTKQTSMIAIILKMPVIMNFSLYFNYIIAVPFSVLPPRVI